VGDAAVEGPFNIPLSDIVDGQNFIAVKIFQQALGSSDITFGYEITAIVDTLSGGGPGPQLAVSKDPQYRSDHAHLGGGVAEASSMKPLQ